MRTPSPDRIASRAKDILARIDQLIADCNELEDEGLVFDIVTQLDITRTPILIAMGVAEAASASAEQRSMRELSEITPTEQLIEDEVDAEELDEWCRANVRAYYSGDDRIEHMTTREYDLHISGMFAA